VFRTFTIDDSALGDLDVYADDAIHRCIHSWQLVRKEKGRCLELGSNPYFITYLLREYTELDLTLANYFGGEEGKCTQVFSWDGGSGRQKVDLDFDHFNLEEARFPYADATFDVVVFCEIIEHLLMNPVHTLKEIRRVLKPEGLLVVTTPNVARMKNVLAMADGLSIYDPYSGFGPYGRHNREYSLHELVQLLKFSGFEPETTFTADAHHVDYSDHPRFQDAVRLVDWRRNDLGQYLFAAVRAKKQPEPGLPASLFRSYPDGELNTTW
jgi:SAM-dependent methyltransferase